VSRPAQQTVLLIEHDAWLRSLLTDILARDEGYAVLPAADGQTGLSLAQQHPSDVILLDLALPDQSGLEVLRQLKTQPPTRDNPVLVVSAYTQLPPDAAGEVAGTVPQPFSLTELVAQVRVAEQLQHGRLVPLKRGASRRVLRLRPWLVDLLRKHQEHLDSLRLKAGQHWRDHGLVFPSSHGTPRRNTNVWRGWKRLLKRAGLPDYKFHELRHTAASLALSEGASLFHVSRMLGHSSIAITADTYGHWTDEGREDVATRLERAILGSQNGVATTLAATAPVGALPAADVELENEPQEVPGGM
jgi:integrase